MAWIKRSFTQWIEVTVDLELTEEERVHYILNQEAVYPLLLGSLSDDLVRELRGYERVDFGYYHPTAYAVFRRSTISSEGEEVA